MNRLNWSAVLPRLLGEFAIIFVGVVLALQFEDWRDNRLGQEKEEAQLRALRVDVARNRELLERRALRQSQVVDAANILMAEFGPEPAGLSPDSIGNLTGWAISIYRLEPVTGAYDALVASGEIGTISSEELRRLLAEYHAMLTAGFASDELDLELMAQLLVEAKGELFGLWASQGSFDPRSPSWANGPVPIAVAESLLANHDFAGLLAIKIQLAADRLSRLENLASRSEALVALIDEELSVF